MPAPSHRPVQQVMLTHLARQAGSVMAAKPATSPAAAMGGAVPVRPEAGRSCFSPPVVSTSLAAGGEGPFLWSAEAGRPCFSPPPPLAATAPAASPFHYLSNPLSSSRYRYGMVYYIPMRRRVIEETAAVQAGAPQHRCPSSSGTAVPSTVFLLPHRTTLISPMVVGPSYAR